MHVKRSNIDFTNLYKYPDLKIKYVFPIMYKTARN